MSEQPETDFAPLSTQELIDKLEAGSPFTYLKCNHRVWEVLHSARLIDIPSMTDEQRKATDQQVGGSQLFSTRFYDEFLPLLKAMDPTDESLYFSVSGSGFPHQDRLYGRHNTLKNVRNAWENALPDNMPVYDGMMLKEAMFDGSLIALIEATQEKRVMIVGPEICENFATFYGLKNAQYFSIPYSGTHAKRDAITQQLRDQCNAFKPDVIFFGAGTLSIYWALLLRGDFANTSFIDLGALIELCNPEKIMRQGNQAYVWSPIFRQQIYDYYKRLGKDDAVRTVYNTLITEPCQYLYEEEDVSTPLYNALELLDSPKRPVNFVEDKPLCYDAVDSLLERSREANHWTNFGPVSRELESAFAASIGLADHLTVVACASGTVALQALGRLATIISGKPSLQWANSALSFMSSYTDIFADAIAVDTDEIGLLSLDKLDAVDSNAWDAMIVTNLYGIVESMPQHLQYALKHKKICIIDNAVRPLNFGRPSNEIPGLDYFEAISCHHTKPMGFGEGGLAILPKKYEETFRYILNFGNALEKPYQWMGLNGKMSDVSAAHILFRLSTASQWAPYYIGQARRINKLALQVGFKTHVPFVQYHAALVNYSAFVAPYPVAKEHFPNKRFITQKYYTPYGENMPNAQHIFDHIVCVPTHVNMAALSDAEITEELEAILANAKTGVTQDVA